MRMDLGMELHLGGQAAPSTDLPVVALTTDLTVEDVGDAIGVAFAYRDLELTGGQDQARAAMQQAMGGLSEVGGRARISPRGEMLEASVELPESLDPTVSSFVEQFEQQMGQLAVPFPRHPVAVGDTWAHVQSLQLSGLRSDIRTTYTLLRLDGDAYAIAVELTQTTEPGPITAPNGEVVGEVLGGEATGAGRFEGDLGFPMPSRGEMSTSGSTRMVLAGGSGEQEMEQFVRVKVLFQPES